MKPLYVHQILFASVIFCGCNQVVKQEIRVLGEESVYVIESSSIKAIRNGKLSDSELTAFLRSSKKEAIELKKLLGEDILANASPKNIRWALSPRVGQPIMQGKIPLISSEEMKSIVASVSICKS